MTNLKMDMQQLKPKTDKFWTNTFWFIMLPFLMDVKEAEKIEYNAFQSRYNRLLIISQEKDCDFASSLSPLKSAEEKTTEPSAVILGRIGITSSGWLLLKLRML